MSILSKNVVTSLVLALSDLICFIFTSYLAILLFELVFFHQTTSQAVTLPYNWLFFHLGLGCVCVSWYSIRLRHYFYRKTFWFELKEILRTLFIFAVLEMAVMSFANWTVSRHVWFTAWFLLLIFLPISRMVSKKVLNKLGFWVRDTFIIGVGPNALEAYKAIKGEKNLGMNIIEFISSEIKCKSECLSGKPVRYIDPGAAAKFLDKEQQYIIALESDESALRNEWLKYFMINGFRYVSVIPTLRGMPLDNTDMSFIFSHEVMIFRVHQNLAKLSSRILKRFFDIACATALVIVLSPLLIYLAISVRKDGGPAIYGHERVGRNGKFFKCLKFRSMVMNSSEVLEEILRSDPLSRLEWEQTFKLKDDPRITKIGSFLRKTSLDELPQLFNVLKGEMSLVGPRPVIEDELSRYSDKIDYYLLSKPGMTGLWQVSGRSDVDYETRVYLDAWYVKNWSMWNDIAILFKTIGVVVKKDGAY